MIQSERNPLARLDTGAENVTVGTTDAKYLEARDTGVVFWRADGRTYAVAGSVDRAPLPDVAESLAD